MRTALDLPRISIRFKSSGQISAVMKLKGTILWRQSLWGVMISHRKRYECLDPQFRGNLCMP
jgi:hypothetical protein